MNYRSIVAVFEETDTVYDYAIMEYFVREVNASCDDPVEFSKVKQDGLEAMDTEMSEALELGGVTYWTECTRFDGEIMMYVLVCNSVDNKETRVVYEVENVIRGDARLCTEIARYLKAYAVR